MHSFLTRLGRDRSGATVIEYGMLIGLLSVVIIVGLENFSDQIINTWLIVQSHSDEALAKD